MFSEKTYYIDTNNSEIYYSNSHMNISKIHDEIC